jgi:hypothetical protein
LTNLIVLFNAHSGNIAGGVFGLQTITTANPGAFLGIQMNVATNLIFGSATPPFNVTSSFQNLTNHSIMPSSWLVLTSSNTNVINIGAGNELIAVGIGTATVTASYLGQTVSQTIVVTPVALHIELSGTNAVISWPTNMATLQSTLNLGIAGSWSPATNSIMTANGTNRLTIPVTNQARYFRLSY